MNPERTLREHHAGKLQAELDESPDDSRDESDSEWETDEPELTAGAAVLFWPAAPAFLLIKGKDVSINKGVTVDVFTDADHTMKSASYQQAPVVTSAAPGAAYPVAGAAPANRR